MEKNSEFVLFGDHNLCISNRVSYIVWNITLQQQIEIEKE